MIKKLIGLSFVMHLAAAEGIIRFFTENRDFNAVKKENGAQL
jgi:hypothetical protein